MDCTTCQILLSEHVPLPREDLSLSVLFESANTGCSRCVIIKDAIMKWTGIGEPERLVVAVQLGDDINREPGRGIELEPGLFVSVWKPGTGEGYTQFALYTDRGEPKIGISYPGLTAY
jgi:hypothetical protein